MDRDTAKETVKGYLEEYLRGKGINTRRPFNCLSPSHNDTHPSMSFDRKANRCKCFSCGVSYDIFDLIGIDYNLTDQKSIFEKAYSLYGLTIDESPRTGSAPPVKKNEPKTEKTSKPPEDFTAYYREKKAALPGSPGAVYLKNRGISEETAALFWLGYDAEYKTFNTGEDGQTSFAAWHALIIPTGASSYIVRNIDKPQEPASKNRYRKKGASIIFNSKAIYQSTRPVFVVEGELDALSIIEAGGQAIGLGSTANYIKLVNMVRERKPEQPLILALDNDSSGRETENKLAEELTALEVEFYRYSPYGAAKDANEALINDRESFANEIGAAEQAREAELKAAKEAAEADYLMTSALAHVREFVDLITDGTGNSAIKTGYDDLDRILDGGLYPGLYIIGAISSLGKTTFALQMADNMAQNEQDVIIFSLEMARAELMAKSISRQTFLLSEDAPHNAKTTRGVLAGARYAKYSKAEKELIYQAIQEYRLYAEHIYIHEGVGNIGVDKIKEIVMQHIAITGNKPVIIIDYLQILAPFDLRASDKQNTDKAVLELKRLSRDVQIPVIGISSFNRDNYTSPVNYSSFKESGAIEYSADVLIGLQYAGIDYIEREGEGERLKRIRKLIKQEEENARQGKGVNIELKVLKNRNGSKGRAAYKFFAKFNCFKESAGDPAPAPASDPENPWSDIPTK